MELKYENGLIWFVEDEIVVSLLWVVRCSIHFPDKKHYLQDGWEYFI